MVGFDNLKHTILGADYRYILLAILMSLIGNLFHTAGWWVLLRKGMNYKISLFKTYIIYISSTFFVNLIPSAAVSGEVIKIYFIQNDTSATRFDKTLAAGLTSRILEILPTSIGVIVGVLYLALFYNVPRWALVFCFIVAGIFIIIAAGVFVVALNNSLLRKLVAAFFNMIGKIWKKQDFTRLAGELEQVLKQFDDSLRSLTRKPLLIATSLFLIFIAWLFDISVAYLSFLALGYHVTVGFVITIYSVTVIIQLLPTFLPGGLGLIEIIMSTMYSALGIPNIIANGATFIIRLVTLWFLTSLGGIVTIYLLRKQEKRDKLISSATIAKEHN
jgi:uncharacterized protein (TIRG00374 family)